MICPHCSLNFQTNYTRKAMIRIDRPKQIRGEHSLLCVLCASMPYNNTSNVCLRCETKMNDYYRSRHPKKSVDWRVSGWGPEIVFPDENNSPKDIA